MELDPRTFIATTSLVTFMLIIVFFAQARSFPARFKGFNTWGLALLLLTISGAAIAARGAIPYLLSVVLANGMLTGGIALLLMAVCRLNNRPMPWIFPLLCVVFVVFETYFAEGFVRTHQIRSISSAVVNGTLIGMTGWALLKDRNISVFKFGAYFTGICFSIMALINFVRLISLLTVDSGYGNFDGLMSEGTIQAFYLASYNIGIILVSIGFIVIGHERLVESGREIANHDELSGAYNRKRFTEAAEQEIKRADRYEGDNSLLLIEIDNLKTINETQGQQAGDSVIKDIASLLKQTFRETDLIGRYNSEEFAVFLPATEPGGAISISERVRGKIMLRSVTLGNDEIKYTASIGVAHGMPGCSLEELIAQAGEALQHAKATGRNRVEIFPV